VALYLVFLQLTLFVFQGQTLPGRSPLPLVAWVASGLAAAAFWCLAAMPWRAWARLAIRCAPLAAPCAVLAGLSLLSGTLAARTWEPLRGWTFVLAGDILKSLGQEIVCRPEEMVLGVRRFSVVIHPYCSGSEGIGLMVLFVGSFLWFFRERLRFPRAFLLFPAGALAIWLVNALRIAALVMFGAYVSPRLAADGFHSQIGWLGFIAVSLGMVGLARRMSFFSRVPCDARPLASVPAVPYLAPLTVLFASAVVTGLFTADGFDALYPVRVVAAAGAVWYFRGRPLPGLQGLLSGLSWRPFAAGVCAFVLWTVLPQEGAAGAPSAIARSLALMPAGLSAAWLFFRAAGSVLVVPAVEELAFRGYLLRRLSPQGAPALKFSWLPFLLSSALFGAMHGRWLAGALAGACYAWSMYRRGRVLDAFVAHAVTNGLIACEVLFLDHFQLWV
jgi:exosortase E/protease (VPEID-CTERM system)